jgi:RNA polymerase sigma factor (sigma-70 family)
MIEITDKHIQIAKACAGKYAATRPLADKEAFEGVALEALVKAAQRFAGNGSFEKYMVQKVWFAMLDESRRSSNMTREHIASLQRGEDRYLVRHKNGVIAEQEIMTVLSLDSAVTENGHSFIEILADAHNDIADSPALIDHREAIAKLKPRLRFVLLGQIDGVTQEELANLMHVSPARVCQLQAKARHEYKRLAA